MADPNNTGTDPGASGGAGGGNVTPPANTGTVAQRPDYVPEQFWNKDKGEANIEGLAKEYATLAGKTTQVPDKYELKLPDNALLKPDAIERTAATAKALGLSQESAQKALEFAHGEVKAHMDGLVKDHGTRTEQWTKDSRADKEIAGEKGELFDANVVQARQTFTQWFGEDVAKLMDSTGFGNHPGVIKGFLKIAKAMAEDKSTPPPNNGAGAEQNPKQLYSNSNMS